MVYQAARSRVVANLVCDDCAIRDARFRHLLVVIPRPLETAEGVPIDLL
jgi:alkylhydroperoxidase family enzyme